MKRFVFVWVGVLGLATGCSSADGAGSDTDSGSTSNDTTGTQQTTAPSGGAGTASMTGASASVTSLTTDPGDGSTAGTGEDDNGFINEETGAGTVSTPQPNGQPCGGNDDCESMFCYQVPMVGGLCSECLTDMDCEFGCGIDLGLGYAVCTDGAEGAMCETDDSCGDGFVCAELLDTGGFFPANFCSECETEAECDPGQLCSPVYDTMSIGGYLGCVDPMSVPDNEGCPIDAGGMGVGEVCLNGHCGVASIFGVVEIGLCGNCTIDDDCVMPETCMPAEASMMGVSGPMCG